MEKQNQSKGEIIVRYTIIILSTIGLLLCSAVLFPQVRRLIMDLGEKILHQGSSTYQIWFETLFSYAMGGIFFILLFDYCTLTHSGKMLVSNVKQEIKDVWSEINFRSLLIPVLIMFGIYFLGILTIIRANFLYLDDTLRSVAGARGWLVWGRYVADFFSIFVHGDTNLTDISPMPQLLAILFLSISSVALIYILCDKKITVVRLLASIPLGLSPFFLESLSYKYDAPYMAMSILASIVPFLFITRKRAFFFISVISLLIMCMTYQAASGIYLLIVIILCFQAWNSQKKSNREILSMAGTAALAFCATMLIFKFFLMRALAPYDYASTTMYPLSQIASGILINIKNYATLINHDLGLIWKIGIALICVFFIIKSITVSSQKKALSFFISILVVGISFILSYGVYILLTNPLFFPRALSGFGVFLAILCIYAVSDYKKAAIVTVLALNWCFLVFAFSYGNALADQARYAEFRITLLLHDLSNLYPNLNKENTLIQLQNSIDFTPSIKNISKHYPVIERLVPCRLGTDSNPFYNNYYYLEHFHFGRSGMANIPDFTSVDFNSLDLPVVKDSYYHTIKSDGSHILVILKP